MFGGFTFASEVPLGRIAAFYGFSVPEPENEIAPRRILDREEPDYAD